MLLRVRSLRVRAILVVAAVVLAPLGLVWVSDIADATVGRRILVRVERLAVEAGDSLADTGTAGTGIAERDAALDALAWRRQVRLRVVDGDSVVQDFDHEAGTGLTFWLGSFFFEPGASPSLKHWDDGEPGLPGRTAVAMARATGHTSGCTHVAEGRLLVCEAALALPDGRVVFVQESSRRSILALHEMRYQLAKLTIVTMGVGLGFGWWLGWRMVRPLEQLSGQLVARAAMRRPTPVKLDRDDEFGDLAVSFNTLIAALAAREKANEAFAADLVHEIKNPVAAVRAAAEALGHPGDAERLRRLARVLRDSSDRLDVLAGRFLELARAEAGLPTDEREPLDMATLATALVEGMRADERHSGVRFELDVAAGATVLGVPERLETALRNVLDNAASFARQGSPAGYEPRVDVRVWVEGDVIVEVRDNGPGIPPEDLPFVFDRFFSRRRHGGTGLGLALARAVVEAHGGTLAAESHSLVSSTGAVFRMRIARRAPG